MSFGASFSHCRRYRFCLTRLNPAFSFNTERRLLWIMLNPSDANELDDDPTIRKCTGFSNRLGFDRYDVGNLFPYVATDPYELLECPDPTNDPAGLQMILQLSSQAELIIAAWGGPRSGELGRMVSRRVQVVGQALGDRPLYCLGTTKDGHPRHPLMLPYTAVEKLRVWGSSYEDGQRFEEEPE